MLAAQRRWSRTSSRRTPPPTSTRPSPSGPHHEHRALALVDRDRPAESRAEHDRRRARRLVLVDARLADEAAGADRRGVLVDPGPGVGGLGAGGRPIQVAHLGRGAELDVLEREGTTRGGRRRRVLPASARTPTSPAGVWSAATATPSRASSQAVPTVGCPAKGSSRPGVKIRTRPRSRSSTKTVSLKPSSAATACRDSSGTAPPSRKTPRGFPHSPSSLTKTRRTWSSGTRRSYAGSRWQPRRPGCEDRAVQLSLPMRGLMCLTET